MARIRPARTRSAAMVRERGKLRSIVVTLYPSGMLGLRPLGLRREETIDADAVWSIAVKMRVAAERADRKARKKGVRA